MVKLNFNLKSWNHLSIVNKNNNCCTCTSRSSRNHNIYQKTQWWSEQTFRFRLRTISSFLCNCFPKASISTFLAASCLFSSTICASASSVLSSSAFTCSFFRRWKLPIENLLFCLAVDPIQYGETHKPLQTFSAPFWKNLPTRDAHKQGVVWPHRG